MHKFPYQTLCILGRQPKLGIAELESLYGADHIKTLPGAALLDINVWDVSFKRLGGSIKLAQILTVLPTTNWENILRYLTEKIPEHMQYQPHGKFTLGLSTYGLAINVQKQNKGLMAIKRSIRATGKSARIVPNKDMVLNSAQVLHNKLTSKGAWELLLVRDGQRTILAQSIYVQDIDSYASRDQARPKRDARVGMLPPKLAQIMINLTNPPKDAMILDPFCGSGVLLQEALLMDLKVLGTDIDQRMTDYSSVNLEWLSRKYPSISGNYVVQQADATDHKWPKDMSAIVSEIYLGKPLSKLPPSEELHKMAAEVSNLLKKFLLNIKSQLNKDAKLCLAVPAWRTKNGLISLPVLDHLTDVGYNKLDFKQVKSADLLYFRQQQIVARQLVVLKKK